MTKLLFYSCFFNQLMNKLIFLLIRDRIYFFFFSWFVFKFKKFPSNIYEILFDFHHAINSCLFLPILILCFKVINLFSSLILNFFLNLFNSLIYSVKLFLNITWCLESSI